MCAFVFALFCHLWPLGLFFVVQSLQALGRSLCHGLWHVRAIPLPPPCHRSSTISWSLFKFMSIVSVMLYNHLILCCPLLLLPSIFPSIWSFPISWLFASGGQSIEVSASATVLPTNIQSWFPLELTGLISLQSKGLSRAFSSTTVQRHQSSPLSFLYGPTHIHARQL